MREALPFVLVTSVFKSSKTVDQKHSNIWFQSLASRLKKEGTDYFIWVLMQTKVIMIVIPHGDEYFNSGTLLAAHYSVNDREEVKRVVPTTTDCCIHHDSSFCGMAVSQNRFITFYS